MRTLVIVVLLVPIAACSVEPLRPQDTTVKFVAGAHYGYVKEVDVLHVKRVGEQIVIELSAPTEEVHSDTHLPFVRIKQPDGTDRFIALCRNSWVDATADTLPEEENGRLPFGYARLYDGEECFTPIAPQEPDPEPPESSTPVEPSAPPAPTPKPTPPTVPVTSA